MSARIQVPVQRPCRAAGVGCQQPIRSIRRTIVADYDVQYDTNSGDWGAKRAGAEKAAGRYETQAEAHEAARVSQNEAAAARFETTAKTITRFGTRTQSAKKGTPTRRRAEAGASSPAGSLRSLVLENWKLPDEQRRTITGGATTTTSSELRGRPLSTRRTCGNCRSHGYGIRPVGSYRLKAITSRWQMITAERL